MRGLSLIGLLVVLGIIGFLALNQLKPSPESGETLPTEAIDKANEAADTMQQEQEALDALEQQVDALEQEAEEVPD
jgi:Tfp pilus assembly protein PilN